MKILLVLAIFIILLLSITVLRLLHKNHKLAGQIENDAEVKRWHTLAFTDSLTGLYNRAAYSNHILEIDALDATDGFAIMVFDIDDFKRINDTKGHLAGDEALKLVAKVLVQVFSLPRHRVYRIGGDEFAVIAKDTTENEIINSLMTLKTALEKDGDIRLSKGYSIIKKNVKSAFKDADEMLYADKASKK